MRVRLLLVVVCAFAVSACGPDAPAVVIYNVAPEYCPYDAASVQFNGDSVGAGYARELRLPAGYSKFEAAQGAATWTIDVQVPTIATRVKQWIEQCGNPGAVVIEGGIIDISRSIALDHLQGVITELSDWLEARGIPTVWVALHPLPSVSSYRVFEDARLEYNAWLTSPGAVWGTAVDCTEALQDPAQPGALHPGFWTPIDVFNTPDGIHPNHEGYVAMAECVRPAVLAALGAT